jgi:hypothetical protein
MAIATFIVGAALFCWGPILYRKFDYRDPYNDYDMASVVVAFIGSNMAIGSAFWLGWIY